MNVNNIINFDTTNDVDNFKMVIPNSINFRNITDGHSIGGY
jgi:hypothetical protein